ncbi:pyruvate dehydrogenase E1 component subunit alpha [Gluconacetobacter sacchari DSM 12717]|uniref:Thiamine pyrophosphate-dependent dehydrogenase E1 component subunit alpha n=2 Tax=Gluconacetobacter sacchari TaxID=92759 RepID=A0A7W4NPM4_9PROT|nr:thiamine pyrophosphate-dependent dehydrogenase E1 component subunit alpha [Gluconacetobacter sacchari]MBB2161774.1 thiamine pyrophosphate-dependent dehydrogenase E1 component subunit alpha [Gluconacetobacter sacchari]GBQ20090.1 pyruvate dehydrogenase E1 component subunit alpha [Gluconacetobacter sacchari DSM 12717]
MTEQDQTLRLERYRRLWRFRSFDDACLEALRRNVIHGELHVGIGQEAIAVGMAESLRRDDAVVSTHRNHFHALAKGVDRRALLAEICEKAEGLCRGRGGHMHPFDVENNFSATGIVGASLPVALGYAYAFHLRQSDAIAVGIAGDGSSHTGAFHETMVIAGAQKLPLLVLVENNSLAISIRFDQISPTRTVAERASAYGVRGMHVDGTDVDAMTDAFAEASRHIRAGGGPVILEATCARFRGHFEGDPEGYRSREERQHLRAQFDPLRLYRDRLEAFGLTSSELDAVEAAEKAAARDLLAEIMALPQPDPEGALLYRFSEEV